MTTFNWLETSRLIDAEWLKSIGFVDNQQHKWIEMFNGYYWIRCWPSDAPGAVWLSNHDNVFIVGQKHTTTRQMMLDALRGLKFPVVELVINTNQLGEL